MTPEQLARVHPRRGAVALPVVDLAAGRAYLERMWWQEHGAHWRRGVKLAPAADRAVLEAVIADLDAPGAPEAERDAALMFMMD